MSVTHRQALRMIRKMSALRGSIVSAFILRKTFNTGLCLWVWLKWHIGALIIYAYLAVC